MEGFKKVIKIAGITLFFLAIIGVVAVITSAAFIYKTISFEADERLFESAAGFDSTTFYADSDERDSEYTPVAVETGGAIRKTFYSLDEISPYLKEGIIAVEDKKFYSHSGVDVWRTMYAAMNYITGREHVFGASTITQQVIKNVSGDNQVTIKRKLGEIVRAAHIERTYSKEDILEVYLNVIPMSENIYGVGAAAKAYFGKDPADLLPEEAATLIGITNAPTAYNPYSNPEACKRKRNIVLSVMLNNGVIDESEYERASNAALTVISRDDREDILDSWFVETVIDDVTAELVDKYGLSLSAARMMLLGGGYKVYTTMSIRVQKILEEYFYDEDNLPDEIADRLNLAMAVTDNNNGYLVGIIGRAGAKSANRLLNHATVPHVPGSVLKPIALYAPLIDEGKINWATVFDDVPVSFTEQDGEYREYPHNSPDVYDGLTTVKDAIRTSKNTVAVRLCNLRGVKNVFRSLKEDFLIDTLVERDAGVTDMAVAPMALGQLSRGVSLRKVTEAYSALSREGEWREAISFLYVVDYKGETVLDNHQRSQQIYKRETAGIMNQLLMTVTESGTAKCLTLKDLVETAGKTGTSGGSKDKWFIGYTPYYTAGIWCGYDACDKPVVGISKSYIEVWDNVMHKVHSEIIETDGIRRFSTDGLYRLAYCKDSGEMYTDVCRLDVRGNREEYGYFTLDNQPVGACNKHILCRYDSLGKGIANDECREGDIVNVALLDIADRAFPKEIYVTDAEFVYRDISGYEARPTDYTLPYFYYTIPDGLYVGRSKSKKQFNTNCAHEE